MLGLSVGSYTCKVSDCTFFLISTLSVSLSLALFNLVYDIRTKTRMNLISAYIGLVNALVDVSIIFVYTKMLRCNSLFFCLLFLVYQMAVSVITCFMPLANSVFLILISALFVHPIFELEFAEKNGFSANQTPKLIWNYLVNVDTSVPFIPILGFKLLLNAFARRSENARSSGFFSSITLFFIGVMLVVFDYSTFHEELTRISSVTVPFIVSNVMLVGSVVAWKLNRDVDLKSAYPPICTMFTLLSLAFCSQSLSWFWQKTIMERALVGPYLFFLVTFAPFAFYIINAYGSSITSGFCRESFVAGFFTFM